MALDEDLPRFVGIAVRGIDDDFFQQAKFGFGAVAQRMVEVLVRQEETAVRIRAGEFGRSGPPFPASQRAQVVFRAFHRGQQTAQQAAAEVETDPESRDEPGAEEGAQPDQFVFEMSEEGRFAVIGELLEDPVVLLDEIQRGPQEDQDAQRDSRSQAGEEAQREQAVAERFASGPESVHAVGGDAAVDHAVPFGSIEFSPKSNYPARSIANLRGSSLTRLSSCASFAVFLLAAACASSPGPETVDRPIVEDKYKLSADRQALDELRAQVPEDKRRENDEIAFALQWMGEVKRPPGQIREKFNSAVSKRRNEFQKDMNKRREEYVKKERAARDAFQKDQENARQDFRSRKSTADERKSFFDDLDARRKDFYTDQREKRDAFESDMRDRRKNFDDYIRERTSEFNQEHRAYVKRFEDWKKDQERKKKEADEERRRRIRNADDEFKTMDQKAPTPLGAGE